MAFFKRSDGVSEPGFLARLLRDRAGNVFAITAAAVVPMIGVVGGAVDGSRMYMVRSRLQAACDSGVLAGRKAMTNNTYTVGNAEDIRAKAMFNVNFKDTDFQTTGTQFNPTGDGNGRVSATASTNIPMTLMKVFGMSTKVASVTCSADVQIPNIDIVFVLDVTGSMGDPINGTDKIDSLKAAAKSFYTTLKNQMDANGANAGQVRYGFVPYSQTVNGKDLFKASPDAAKGELPMSHLTDSMTVESRVANFAASGSEGEWIDDPNSSAVTYDQVYDASRNASVNPYAAQSNGGTVMSNLDCEYYGDNKSFSIDDNTARRVQLYPRTSWPGDQGIGDSPLYSTAATAGSNSPAATATRPASGVGASYWQITFDRVSTTWEDNSGQQTSRYRTCTRRVTWNKYIWSSDYKFTNWTYQPVTYNVSAFKTGGTVSFARPRWWDGSRWQENDNRDFNDYDAPAPGSYNPVELAATDDASHLNIDTFTWNGCLEERDTVAQNTFSPIPANAYDLNYLLGGTSTATRWRPIMDKITYNRGQSANVTVTTTVGAADHSCPTARMRNLNTMTQSAFNTYIDSLQPNGYTYLDIGMIWGLRLIAPQGMFSSRNLTGPNGGQISRHIIFLTDGEPVSADSSVTSYGLEAVSKRITGSTGTAAATLHARRFQALCDSQRGSVAIWAIAFGTAVTGNLSSCADPGRAFQADDSADLNNAFNAIARDIADLRLVS